MSYTALYRKWRPSSFEDVRGQDHIVQTLKNQIVSGRIGHAYLFCGTRGTGKTSIAKIFAKAVNCENPIDGSPCNNCDTCKRASSGISLNVVEIDAASNNGVENIREIREQVQYPPTDGKFRVYIIDEVHMLSTGAFNALLKTLEEPPSYVIFILATTEVHKIPITVMSRCQRYDFRRITIDIIAEQLKDITQSEEIEVEERALRYVAKAADGSMRDALSLLDQCIAFHFGEILTYENVLEVLGAVDTSIFSSLFQFVIDGNTAECIYKLDELVVQGRELGQFVIDFIWYMRNLLLLKTTANGEDMLEMSAENMAVLKEEAKQVEEETLMRFIRVFSELASQIRYASQKRVLVELAFIRLTRPAMQQDLSSVIQRIALIEKQLEQGISIVQNTGETVEKETIPDNKEEPNHVVLPKSELDDLNLVKSEWGKITKEIGMAARPSLSHAILEPGGEKCLCIVFLDSVNHAIGSRENILAELSEYVKTHYDREIRFKTRLKSGSERFNTIYVSDEELKEKIHINIEIED